MSASTYSIGDASIIIPGNGNEVVFGEDGCGGNLSWIDECGALVPLARGHLRLDELVHGSQLPVLRGLMPTFLTTEFELKEGAE